MRYSARHLTNPANDYVADFVAHMNPLGVLTARDVMEPTAQPHLAGQVPADQIIQEVMAQVLKSDTPLGVTENGALIGQITRTSVLAKLLDPRA